MTDAQIYAGTLTANREDRTATGLLVPYGEQCSSNLGRFAVDSGAFTIPADLNGVGLNVEHERENAVGSVTALRDTDQGVVATFSFARTPEGDAALDDVLSGRRRSLSAEVANVMIRAGKAISGRIFGAALVKQGAFPSATLLAAAVDTVETPTQPNEPTETTSSVLDEFTDEDGITHKRTVTTTTRVEIDADGTEKTTITEKTVIEEPDAPANTEGEPAVAEAPSTMTAAKAAEKKQPDLGEVATLLASVRTAEGTAADTLMAALTDIKISGTGQLPVGGSAIQPAWLGELWNGRAYQRKYMSLIRNGNITAIDEKGFVLTGTDDLVKPWAGNKTELPTGSAVTEPRSSVFQRWGWAADIAREYFDIPAGRPVIEAFLRRIAESYARATDTWSLAQIVSSVLADNKVAPATYPTEYPEAMGQLIQGIEAVDANGDSPSFAIANQAAWTELMYTPKDQVPEFVSFNFGITSNGSADGSVTVVKGNIGIDDSPAVLVGSRAAAHVNELPGASPLQLDALDIARGGVDRAVIGYTQYMADFPDGLVLVGTADTP